MTQQEAQQEAQRGTALAHQSTGHEYTDIPTLKDAGQQQ